MSDNFQKTVNLKEEFERQRAAERATLLRTEPAEKTPKPAEIDQSENHSSPSEPSPTPPFVKGGRNIGKESARQKERAAAIDQVYKNEPEQVVLPELQKIIRPKIKTPPPKWLKPAIIAGAIVVICAGTFFLLRGHLGNKAPAAPAEVKWYAVKLINNETYYGQIGDTSADPIVIDHVYYNYDQLTSPQSDSGQAEKTSGTGTLRLVKRGQETHGPNGTMDVVRAQVVYMEPLKDDSKVLKAILEYEKQ
jgi:hypothetical protein